MNPISFIATFAFLLSLQITLSAFDVSSLYNTVKQKASLALGYSQEEEREEEKEALLKNHEKNSGYLTQGYEISQEALSQLLCQMLDIVIDGADYAPGSAAPEFLAGWIPDVTIPSTLSRRNRYLREYQGSQDAATDAAIARNHAFMRKLKIMVTGFIPVIGMPTSYSVSLWHQLREIALIAALNGHDLHNPQVRTKILDVLIVGDAMKIPALSVDLAAKALIKQILIKAGMSPFSISLPTHMIFNYFTENSAKVATHAKAAFAGEHSLQIQPGDYLL